MLGRLDNRLAALATKFGLAYTRYVDDLTFSGDSIGVRFIAIVSQIVRSAGFEVNQRKTRLMRGRSPKYVTGLSVGTGRLRLPRATRRMLRNEAFQLLHRGVDAHMDHLETADPLVMERVLGRLAYWLQVEPEDRTANRLFQELLAQARALRGNEPLEPPRRFNVVDEDWLAVVRAATRE